MPLFKNFYSTNVRNAFILNSLATAFIVTSALFIKTTLDNQERKANKVKYSDDTFTSYFYTFLVTIISSLLSYYFLFYMFGYGGGMLVN